MLKTQKALINFNFFKKLYLTLEDNENNKNLNIEEKKNNSPENQNKEENKNNNEENNKIKETIEEYKKFLKEKKENKISSIKNLFSNCK